MSIEHRIDLLDNGARTGRPEDIVAAYACAVLAAPACADYAFVAHASAEPGHQPALERLARLTPHPAWGRPLLHLGMRLGEGTGAAMAYPLLKGDCALYANMASLADVGAAGPSA